MPQDRASAEELLGGVEAFLRKDVLPQLSGASIYKCRVAANILSIVQRELAKGEQANSAELEGLQALLGRQGEGSSEAALLDDLNGELCAGIRSGKLDEQRDVVMSHVRSTLQDKLAIANPKYAGYRESLGE
ncbi:MAG: hypothetical protein KBT88_06215 [Gammaproteobacteria bacterium]|nr:hypothetical protein [Gammaproteobacteria bacterium]MBQ0839363.1 hypothetical protein [Gammaproteobacteria bacterium]